MRFTEKSGGGEQSIMKDERVLLVGAGMTSPKEDSPWSVTAVYLQALNRLGYETAVVDDLPHPGLAGQCTDNMPIFVEPLSMQTILRLMRVCGCGSLYWELRGGHSGLSEIVRRFPGAGDPFRQADRWRAAERFMRRATARNDYKGFWEKGWAAVSWDGYEARLLAASVPQKSLRREVFRRTLEMVRSLGLPGVWEMELLAGWDKAVKVSGVSPHPVRLPAFVDDVGGISPVDLHLRLARGEKPLRGGVEVAWLDENMASETAPQYVACSEMDKDTVVKVTSSRIHCGHDEALCLGVGCIPIGKEIRLVLWEELEESGLFGGAGLAIAPPCRLGGRMALEVLHKVAEEIRRPREFAWVKVVLWKGRARVVGIEENIRQWPFAFWAERILGSARISNGELFIPEHTPFCGGRGPYLARVPVPRERSSASEDMVGGGLFEREWDYGLALGSSLDEVLGRMVHQRLGGRPAGKKVVLSVADREKREAISLARELTLMGYEIYATEGTARAIRIAGMEARTVRKLREGSPNIVDLLRDGQVDMVVNVPRGHGPRCDGDYIRDEAARFAIPCFTRVLTAWYMLRGMKKADPDDWEIMPLRSYRENDHGYSYLAG